jgi:hypothetical protein
MVLMLAVAAGVGCAHAEKKDDTTAQPMTPPTVPTVARPAMANPGGRATEFAKTRVQITEPKDNAVVTGPDVKVYLHVEGYKIGNGPHLHLILDNEPYIRVDTTSQAVVLKNLKPGAHILRAFASRPWHESIKGPMNFSTIRFVVGSDDGAYRVDRFKPLLTYSRPKGEYMGAEATAPLMVDFVVRNTELSPTGNKVKLTVDGKWETLLDSPEPIWIPGLPAGEHTFVTELVDATGKPIDNGGVNRTERKITLSPNAAPTAHGTH